MTAEECIAEIETILRLESNAENLNAGGVRGLLRPHDAAEMRVEALREIKAATDKYRVYGERR